MFTISQNIQKKHCAKGQLSPSPKEGGQRNTEMFSCKVGCTTSTMHRTLQGPKLAFVDIAAATSNKSEGKS